MPQAIVFLLLWALEAAPSTHAVVGRCNYNLVLLWTRESGHAPFAAPPLIADVNLDGQPDVIAAPFTDQVTVLRGDNGRNLPNYKWPQQLVDTSVHASPLTYDIDGDGTQEILVITTDGQLVVFNPDGSLLPGRSFKLPGLQIARNWSKEQVTVDQTQIHSYILDKPPIDGRAEAGFLVVDPHVLATPVIIDLNSDNQTEEMIIPVSYYFDHEYYSDEEKQKSCGLSPKEVSHYLAGSICVFNLTSGQIVRTTHLELTKVDAEFPGYVMFTPTVVDLDGDHGSLEVIVGTSAGQIHVVDAHGAARKGWPVARDSVHGQVRGVDRPPAGGLVGQILVADIDLDGELEIVAMDTSSILMCYHGNAKLIWETQISGSSTSGPRVADINQDGKMDIVIGTNDGLVWVIEGSTGAVMNQWPFRVGKSLSSPPLITRLSSNSALDVVVLADDAHLHIVSGDGKKCRHAISLGETSLVNMLTYDLVPHAAGMELLVATRDGTLMCLGRREPEVISRSVVVMDGLPSESRTANDFTFSNSKIGVVIQDSVAGVLDVTGTWMALHFSIVDELRVHGPRPTYKVKVYFGKQLLATSMYGSPGTYYLTVPAPWRPAHGHLQVVMTTRHGIVYQDSAALRFNMLFLRDLQWLLVCPFVCLAAVLLLLHGYPAVDLLPVTHTSKQR